MTSGPNIALLWRGQAAEWTHRFHEARQWPVLYRDEAVREIRDELLSCDAVLVWVNPLDISGDRSQLDPMLREVAGCGVVVSAHPDVIAKIGVKEVLYTTRSMEWGSDVDRYVDAEGLRARFPEHLAAGPRVLKPNYGNGGSVSN